MYSLSELDGFRTANGAITNIGNIPTTAIVSESQTVIGDFNEFDDTFNLLRAGGEGQPYGVAAPPGVRGNMIGDHIGVFDDSLLETFCLNNQMCVEWLVWPTSWRQSCRLHDCCSSLLTTLSRARKQCTSLLKTRLLYVTVKIFQI